MKTKKLSILLTFLFAVTSLLAQKKWNPSHPSWTDSYASNGFCWCNTTFDHDLDNINKVSFNINGKRRNIKDICDELKKHPKYRGYVNGNDPFNDIQCGHGPANTAPDEKGCPGRTNIGNKGCFVRGPKWDVAWLKGRSRFGGGGSTPAPTPTTGTGGAPIGKTIGFRKSGGNKFYVTAYRNSNGNQLKAKGGNLLLWEKFVVEAHPRGGVALKALSNGKYIQVVGGNQNAPVRAQGNAKGDWERFEWKSKGNGKMALKSLHTNKWLQASWNSTEAIVYPRGNSDLGWETFEWQLTSGGKSLATVGAGKNTELKVIPNPVNSSDTEMYLEITSSESAKATIAVHDLTGKSVVSLDYTVIDGVNSMDLSAIKSLLLDAGVYILSYNAGSVSATKKIVVQ